MRWKIIIVNAGIIVVVAILTFVLLATSLRGVLADPVARRAEAERAIRSANAQLELDGLRLERWLAEQASTAGVQDVFADGTPRAQQEKATVQANRVRDAASAAPGFAKMVPSLVLFVDAQGVALGRDGSNLMRGDPMGEFYPSLTRALKEGRTMSDVWLDRQREEQLLASYAPVRNDRGEVVGGIVAGTPLSDERLTRTSDLTSGKPLILGVKGKGPAVEIVAKSEQTTGEALGVAQSQVVKDAAGSSLGKGSLAVLTSSSKDFIVGTAPLAGYGDNTAALIAAVPASLVTSMTSLLWPVLAVGALGILLVIVGGFVLGNYISSPISEVEDGLLQIINGKTDLRFQLEHPDLGGLIFRINSLLNALMGVPETDEEGRTSAAPGQPYE